MKFPHVVDYLSGDYSVLEIPTKICVIKSEHYDKVSNDYYLEIRQIHHFGNRIWLGRVKNVTPIIFERVGKQKGTALNIMTSKTQYIVPREIDTFDSSKVTLLNERKSIYNVEKDQKLKEVVLVNNQPKLIDYKLEEYKSFSDDRKGVKGTYYIQPKDIEVLVF